MRCVPRGLRCAPNLLSVALLISLVGISATHAAAATCASLAGLGLPDTAITAAQSIPAGNYTAPDGEVFSNLPAFCRIAATLTPTSDSNIKIEVWMPYSGWNGRYVGTGNAGIGGLIVYLSLAHFLALNYAVANTDYGTSPAATDPLGARVLTGHPEKQIDYSTRSTNLMTVRSKQIIEAFYDERPKYSYFLGCSTGGGKGMHEALQFPGDYDGIVAGAPTVQQHAPGCGPYLGLPGIQQQPGEYHCSPGERGHCRDCEAMCRQRWRFELGQFSDRPAGLPLGSGGAAVHGRSSRRSHLPDGAAGCSHAKVLRRADQPAHG